MNVHCGTSHEPSRNTLQCTNWFFTVHPQCTNEFLEISQTLYDYRGNNPHSARSAQSAPYFWNPFYKSGQNRFLTVNALRVWTFWTLDLLLLLKTSKIILQCMNVHCGTSHEPSRNTLQCTNWFFTVHPQCTNEFLEISQTLYDYRGNNPHSARSAQSAPYFWNPFYKSGQNRFLTVNALRVWTFWTNNCHCL